ncbi:MAG: hypothetical protein LUH22_08430 [Bacteroides sp.]|nr:hypothetical protein [Bacteroides sp.]
MKSYIEFLILGKEDEIVNLKTILKKINGGENFFWKILWINGSGNQEELGSVVELEQMINNSKLGIPCSWSELQLYASPSFDLEEMLIIGDSNEEVLHRYEDDELMKESCEFCIELIDTSHWEISTKNRDLICNLKDISEEGIR